MDIDEVKLSSSMPTARFCIQASATWLQNYGDANSFPLLVIGSYETGVLTMVRSTPSVCSRASHEALCHPFVHLPSPSVVSKAANGGREEPRRGHTRDLEILFHLVVALLLVGDFTGHAETRSHLSRRTHCVEGRRKLGRTRPPVPVLSAGVTGMSRCPCTRHCGLRTPGHTQAAGGRGRLC